MWLYGFFSMIEAGEEENNWQKAEKAGEIEKKYQRLKRSLHCLAKCKVLIPAKWLSMVRQDEQELEVKHKGRVLA